VISLSTHMLDVAETGIMELLAISASWTRAT